ncbi:MAG TPA: response regulator [Candidatus Methylomirabilis sp.]|nr:response regulator [Candidatus Methylomirabilis sp.]
MAEERKKILIAEDDLMLLDIMAERLSQENFEVIKAKDGEEALALALKLRPDLILLDILMPKMDGVTMLKKLREDKKSLATPVIILTNVGYGQQIEEALKHGVQDFLVKTNWKLEDVVEKIKQKLAINGFKSNQAE